MKNYTKINDYGISKKIMVFTKITRLRASPRHGGSGRFLLHFPVIDPTRGRPVRRGFVNRKEDYKVTNPFFIFEIPGSSSRNFQNFLTLNAGQRKKATFMHSGCQYFFCNV